MTDERFRGDPYRVLDVAPDASSSAIKRRWRELAREHHPDRAAGDRDEAARLTGRMARINAAYDLLRDPGRRARFDGSPGGRRSRARAAGAADWAGRAADWAGGPGAAGGRFAGDAAEEMGGPPPPPASPPVTGRFDTSTLFRPRNTTLHGCSYRPSGHELRRRAVREPGDLRASTPTGPVERRASGRREPPPSLREARETELEFGKFRGYTLGEVALLEPTYVDWLAQTITRDHDLVRRARVVQADLDHQGVIRRARQPSPGWGRRAGETESERAPETAGEAARDAGG